MIPALRLLLRSILTIFWGLIILFPLFVTSQLRLARLNSGIMQFSFFIGCLIWGVRVTCRGAPAKDLPLLMVSNHFSYLDVFALGSTVPAHFTPKREVANWPFIGLLCRTGGCIFIDRRPSRTLHNKSELEYALRKNYIISLFPEGTTSDGSGLLPFKSSFFSIAEENDLMVQPVSVLYTHLNGKPVDAAALPIIGWYGDSDFFPHATTFLMQKNVDVTLIFHTAFNGGEFESRKELAAHCREIIAAPLA